MSVYAADGSINITIVDGATRVGRYAPDGSWYAVVDPTPRGLNNPCGALNITEATGTDPVSVYSPKGFLRVSTSPYTPTGGQRVTVISGVL